MTGTIVTHTTPTAVDLARRANRLFLASFGAFIGLVLVMIIGLSERQTAEEELARRLDVDIRDIPPSQLADVMRDTWNTPAYVAIAGLAVLSVALFSHGMRTLGGLSDVGRRALVTAATVLPYAGVVAFLCLLGIERALTDEPGWLIDNWWLWDALLAAFVLAVTVSLVLIVVATWPTGLARRTSLAVLVLAALVAVLSVTAGAPPILPILLAAVFAFNVRRAASARSGLGASPEGA